MGHSWKRRTFLCCLTRLKNTKQKFFLTLLFSSRATETCRALMQLSLVGLWLFVVLTDLEVAQLVRLLVGRHHPQPVPQIVLLQVLLRQVLQVPAEGAMGEFSCIDATVRSSGWFGLTSWRTVSQTSRWSCSSCGPPGRCSPGSQSFRSPWSALSGTFPARQITVMR